MALPGLLLMLVLYVDNCGTPTMVLFCYVVLKMCIKQYDVCSHDYFPGT